MRKQNFLSLCTLLLICTFLLLVNCSKKDSSVGNTTTPVPVKSNEAKLTTFVFKKQNNTSLNQDYLGIIDETNKKVTFNFPSFSQVTNLVASFAISEKATAKVGSTNQQSEVTPNIFTSPVVYTIVAEDGTTQNYTVTITVQQSDDAFFTSFSFLKNNNSGIAKDITGLLTKDDKEIHLRNPYLTKNGFVANFTVSPGATVKVNGITQVSGVTNNTFSGDVIYEVTAQSGKVKTYKIKTTSHILKFDEFIQECPTNDPNINKILADFQIRIDGNLVSSFPCAEPYYPMTKAQYNDQIKWLQTLRILFYLDYGQENHLPWTNLRIYDWLKSKIGGINIVTGLNGGYCCNTFDGKSFINVGALKNNSFGNFAEIPNLDFAWSMNNFVLLLHETRHRDGFPHSDCCVAGTARCDSRYDLTNLSPYGMHIWWYNAVLSRQFDFGFDCLPNMITSVIDGTWNSMNNQKTNFCTQPTIPAKPAYWNDCKYK